MATAAPDPRTFESWEDAFQYPIPTVRALEKKLRTHIHENNDKLRSLVGSSYRDLLGTANTIVTINEEMQQVEDTISSVARRSDSRILDKISRNHARLVAFRKEQQRPQASLASQMAVLDKTLDLVARLLRSRGSTLLAAKLLVVSRLLHKSSSQSKDVTGFVEGLGNKLASLRSRLLKHIDRNLSALDNTEHTLVEDLTAFSLATSSSPTDVLVHFHHLRLDAIRRAEKKASPDSSSRAAIKRLGLYVGTCRETRATFPDVLRASLRSLSAAPLFRDPAIRAFDELRLDVHEQWISDEVRNYTPFTRHDELQKAKAMQILQDWTSKSLDALISSIKTDLGSITDLELLLKARKETLQTWLSSRQHVRGFSHQSVLNQLREPFHHRALAIVKNDLQSLQRSVQEPVNGLLIKWQSGVKAQPAESLWHSSTISMDPGGGAIAFKKAIIHRRNGKGEDRTFDVLDQFEDAANTLEGVTGHIKRMQDARWDDDYDMDDEDEDTDNGASVVQLLSKDDPAALQKQFRSSIHTSVQSMESWLSSNITDRNVDCTSADSSGVILLRILRELRHKIPQLRLSLDPSTPQTLFGQDLVSKIQAQLVASVQQAVDEQLQTNLAGLANKRLQIHSLWDGTPPIPVLPSPAIFKHLRAVVKRMELLGSDLWSPDVVAALKRTLARTAVEHIHPHIKHLQQQKTEKPTPSADEQEANGKPEAATSEVTITNGAKEETEEPKSAETDANANAAEKPTAEQTTPNGAEADHETATTQSREKLVQLLFDTLYLQQALSLKGTGEEEDTAFDAVLTDLETSSELANADVVRVRKGAAEYWRRTYLLFGLLSY